MVKKENKIRKKRDYNNIYKNGKIKHGKYIIVFTKKNILSYNRFGIVTSKKIGTAVIRNRVKRQIRAIIIKNKEKIKFNYDIVIVTRHNIKNVSFKEIEKDFINALRKAGLY